MAEFAAPATVCGLTLGLAWVCCRSCRMWVSVCFWSELIVFVVLISRILRFWAVIFAVGLCLVLFGGVVGFGVGSSACRCGTHDFLGNFSLCGVGII